MLCSRPAVQPCPDLYQPPVAILCPFARPMCSTDRLQHYRDAGTAARSSRLLLTPYTGRNRNVVTSGETGLLRVHTMLRLLFSLIVLAFIAGAPALAQQQPPARVGRVSFISGNLALHTAGQSEWSAGTVNY